MPGWHAEGLALWNAAAAQQPVVLHALALTGLAALVAVPLVLALAHLPRRGAVVLTVLLLAAALLPLARLNTTPAEIAALLPLVALPPAWGLRATPPGALKIAASLVGPMRVFFAIRLGLAAPWLAVGLALGFARALVEAGMLWPADLMLTAAVALVAWMLAVRAA